MVKVTVCVGGACHLEGAHNVIYALHNLAEKYGITDDVSIETELCLNHCTKPVSVTINDKENFSISCNKVYDFFLNNVLCRIPNH